MGVLKFWPSKKGFEQIFSERYPRLVGWAQQLIGRNRAAAEDLVHDTFIRVALRNPDLDAVSNLDGYLYATMRNVYLSRVRRESSKPLDMASLLDHESLEASLSIIGTHHHRHAAYEELLLIARYACIRKATSKAASVLILRFFHGYFPAEIARLLVTTEGAVDARLRTARAEARAWIGDPNRLGFNGALERPLETPDLVAGESDFVDALRRLIFDVTSAPCPTPDELEQLYARAGSDSLDTPAVAHLVSCASCLDNLNRRFGFPLLRDRHPSDMLGRSGRGRGGNGSGSDGSGPSGCETAFRTRLKDTLNDHPKELRIAVNGLFVAVQTVSGAVSHQQVRILVQERLGFIEVFSEHGTCLLYLDVTSPPDGPVEDHVEVPLSNGRQLTATLTFRETAPVLSLVYEDPTWSAAPSVASETVNPQKRDVKHTPRGDRWFRFLRALPSFQPSAVITTVVACAVALWGWALWKDPRVSAAEVLRSAGAADVRELSPTVARHRVLTVEERLLPQSRLVRRQRVEVWQQGVNGTTAKRLYDEQNTIVGGEWVRSDGTRTVYRPGAAPVFDTTPGVSTPLTSRDIWRREPSAAAFTALAATLDEVTVEARDAHYLLTYRPAGPESASGLVEATLTVAKSDGRAEGQRLVIREEGTTREFTFNETSIQHLPLASVAPTVFLPEPALSGDRPIGAEPVKIPRLEPVVPAVPTVSPVELDRLELEATYRLFRSRIWVGQTAEIARGPRGIVVRTLVPTEADKETLHRSFGTLVSSPAITLDVQSAAQASPPAISPGDAGSIDTIPAHQLLAAFFGWQAAGPERDTAITVFSTSVLETVNRRDERVRALATLTDRWPEPRLLDLDLETVVTWQSMVQQHAAEIAEETKLLRLQLQPVFKIAADTPQGPKLSAEPLTTVREASDTTARLVELADRQAQEMRGAFSTCSSPPCEPPNPQRLLQSLTDVERLASRFNQFYLKLPNVSDRQKRNHQ